LNILLIPLEVLSFFARFVSLSVRLFANMMAGHLLLKIFLIFISLLFFGLVNIIGSFASFFVLSLLILVIFFLEFGIAVLQAYVFILLCIIYFSELFELH
jgi:F-type H+-transporting ATPase subunit a